MSNLNRVNGVNVISTLTHNAVTYLCWLVKDYFHLKVNPILKYEHT